MKDASHLPDRKHPAGRWGALILTDYMSELRSKFAKEADNLSENLNRGDDDRLHCVVFRLKAEMAVLFIKALDRRIVFNQRDDNLAVVRIGLPAHDDVVIIEDAGLNHAVTADAKDKVLAFANQIHREHHLFIDAFFCEDGLTGGNAADDRKLAYAAVVNRSGI